MAANEEAAALTNRLRVWLEHPTSSEGHASADGQWRYFLSTRDGIPFAYRLRANGGEPERLDSGTERVLSVQPAPDGSRVMVAVDRGGNEQWQLALFDPDVPGRAGALRWLTSDGEVIHNPGAWRDGVRYTFTSNARDRRFFDIYEMDLAGDAPAHPLHVQDVLVDVVAADRSRVLARRSNTNLDSDLLLLNGSGSTEVTPHSGELTIFSADLAADGVLAAANPERELAALVRYRGGSGELLQEFDGDLEIVSVDYASQRVALSVNDRGWSRLFLLDLATNQRQPVDLRFPALITGVDWTPGGRALLIDASSPTAGTEVLEQSLPSGEAHPIAPSPRPIPSVIPSGVLREFPASDGLRIPFWDARPQGREPRGTIVYVHGGPESQFRPRFLPVHSFLIEQGWRVISPNVRGSTGYGRTYVHLDDVRRRMDSVRDLRDLARFLLDGGELPPGSLGIMGGSYGGFMVLSALTTYPELWAAGAEWVGIANFVTFLERTRPWRRKIREDEYGSLDRDRAFLEEISPLHRVDRIRAPLFVVHGANDPRVPVEEAEQIVGALRARGVPVEYLRYENEGHGLVRRENQIEAYSRAARFFADHLPGVTDPPPSRGHAPPTSRP